MGRKDYIRQEFAPGMRVIIRDEEWKVKKVVTNSIDSKTLMVITHYALRIKH